MDTPRRALPTRMGEVTSFSLSPAAQIRDRIELCVAADAYQDFGVGDRKEAFQPWICRAGGTVRAQAREDESETESRCGRIAWSMPGTYAGLAWAKIAGAAIAVGEVDREDGAGGAAGVAIRRGEVL